MKRVNLLLTLLLMALAMTAAPVSPATARQAAQRFLKAHGAQLKGEALRAPSQATVPGGSAVGDAATYYVFNASASKGFVIVSGDDCMGDNLVLGYANSGSFDADDVPANMQSWLDNMSLQIAKLSRLQVKAKTIALHNDIEPMVTSTWGQGENYYNPDYPYNRLCPETDGELCCTGCMATALAQVMRFHRCPQTMAGPLPSYTMENGRVIEGLPAVTFDWDNMLDTYEEVPTTDAQQTAVATLMRYCGQLCQMDYTPEVSNGLYYDLDLLVTMFGYDPDVCFAVSESYSPSAWDELLYNELHKGRPFVFAGYSTGGGHAFLIDGYEVEEGAGYYHVNWGWDGESDGYFRINNLEPNESGTGASSTSDGYNNRQEVLINLQPASKPLENYGRYLSDFEWNTIIDEQPNVMVCFNTSYKPGTFSIALAERQDDGTPDCTRLYNYEELQLEGYTFAALNGQYLKNLNDISVEGLEPGSHNLMYVNKESGTDAPWKPIFGTNCYIEVNVDETGQTTETLIHPMPKLTSSSRHFRIDGLRQMGVCHNISAPISNSGEDYIGTIECYAYYVENNTLAMLTGYSIAGCMIESQGTCDVNFKLSFPMTGRYVVVLTKKKEEDISGTQLSDIKNTNGYIVHKTIDISELTFYCTDFNYNVGTNGMGEQTYSLDLTLYNGTTEDYDALLLANLYQFDEVNQTFNRISVSDDDYLHTYIIVNSHTSYSTSFRLPEPLQPGYYGIDLLIANDFNSWTPNDYFLLTGGTFNVSESVGITEKENDYLNNENTVYDIQGLPVSTLLRKPGLYIRNGHKVVIR